VWDTGSFGTPVGTQVGTPIGTPIGAPFGTPVRTPNTTKTTLSASGGHFRRKGPSRIIVSSTHCSHTHTRHGNGHGPGTRLPGVAGHEGFIFTNLRKGPQVVNHLHVARSNRHAWPRLMSGDAFVGGTPDSESGVCDVLEEVSHT
jgi:hypothetical protein